MPHDSANEKEIQTHKNMKFIASNFWVMSSWLLGGMATLVWVAAGARILGPEVYGEMGILRAIFWIASSFTLMGIHFANPKFISAEMTSTKRVKEYAYFSTKYLTIIGVIVFIVMTAFGLYLRQSSLSWSYYWIAFIVIGLSILLCQIGWAIKSTLQGLKKIKNVAIMDLFFYSGYLVSICFLLYLPLQGLYPPYIGSRDLAVGIASLFTLIASLSALIPGIIFMRKVDEIKLGELFRWRKEEGYFKRIISFGFFAMFPWLMWQLMANVGLLMVRSFVSAGLTSWGEYGVYSFAHQLSIASLLVCALGVALLPFVSEADALKDKEYLASTIRSMIRSMFILVIGMIFIFIIFGPVLLAGLGGAEWISYAKGKDGLMVGALGSAFVMWAVYYVISNALLGINEEKKAMIVGVTGLSIYILMSYLVGVGLNWGIWGTILGIIVSGIFVASLSTFLLFHITKIKFPFHMLSRPLIAILPPSLILRIFVVHWLTTSPLILVLQISICVFAYLICLSWVGAINDGDYDMIRNSLNSRLKRYIGPLIDFSQRIAKLSPLYK